MSNPILTLGFSTIHDNFESLICRLNSLVIKLTDSGLIDLIEIFVVVQHSLECREILIDGMRVYYTNQSGLSNSRNNVISMSKSSYIWLLDDDVVIETDDVKFVLDELSKRKQDIYIGQIRCCDSDGSYKDYSRNAGNRFWTLMVSSIEIIVSREFLVKKRIQFDTQIGLGTGYPTGEENLFLIDCVDRGASHYFFHRNIIGHPCEEEKRSKFIGKNIEGLMVARGFIARKFGFFVGFFLCLYWSFKFSYSHRNPLVLIWIIKGFSNKL
jgi:glycosyltransferase involved in cell wall biosynthesis